MEQPIFRLNAGGPGVAASDGGPNWLADEGSSSPYRNTGSNAAGWSPVGQIGPGVPSWAPSQLFDTERWDPGSRNDGGEMRWAIPVPAGEELTVRLYFANRYDGTSNVGGRVFDVVLEGTTVLTDYDIVSDVGHNWARRRPTRSCPTGRSTCRSSTASRTR